MKSLKTTPITLSLLLATALLAGCGSDSGKTPASTEAAHRAAVASLPVNASTTEVAAHMRGDVKCPADLPPAPQGTPVDDVVGVRPGITYEQAANAVMCSNPLLVVTPETGRGFDIQTYGQTIRQGFSARFAEARVQKTGRQIVQEMERDAMDRTMNARRQDMQPGQSKWFVSTMGMPGQEKVISAAREQWFDEGKNPTIDSVTQSLIAKYGTPTWKMDDVDYRRLRWAYDPRGRLITETSPLYNQCGGTSDPDSGMSLSADCGIVIAALIQSPRSNHALAQFLQVGVVDQAGGYNALTATKHGLQAMDAQKRAKQVKDASKNADAVKL
ncbi:MAG TPA: hypothetical protein VFW60_04155 [Rhodanobacteraceae bacterium]|nr:hypothetical protein [Rhodanobacteraceae bacterium]